MFKEQKRRQQARLDDKKELTVKYSTSIIAKRQRWLDAIVSIAESLSKTYDSDSAEVRDIVLAADMAESIMDSIVDISLYNVVLFRCLQHWKKDIESLLKEKMKESITVTIINQTILFDSEGR